MTSSHKPLTQEEVNAYLENMHDSWFAVEKQHFERLQRIESIARALAGSDNEVIARVERMLGLRPVIPRQLQWWERWWAASLMLLMVTAAAAVVSAWDVVVIDLAITALASAVLYLIERGRRLRGMIE